MDYLSVIVMALRSPDISEFNKLKREFDDLKQIVLELRKELRAHTDQTNDLYNTSQWS